MVGKIKIDFDVKRSTATEGGGGGGDFILS
jgi:hypothetical protein